MSLNSHSAQSKGYLKTYGRGLLIGALIGLAFGIVLDAVGIIEGVAVPIFVAGVSAAHIFVSHFAAVTIGASTVAVVTTVAGAGGGALVKRIYDKRKAGSSAKISKILRTTASPAFSQEGASQRHLKNKRSARVTNDPDINQQKIEKESE